MNSNGRLTEFAKCIPVLSPRTQNNAAVDSLYVDLKYWQRCAFLIQVGNRAGATVPDITLTQATSRAGAGAKSLAFDTSFKTGAVTQAADADALTLVTSDGDSVPLPITDDTLVIIEIRNETLDTNNLFRWVKCSVATPGVNDVPIAILAILHDGSYAAKESALPSAL